MAIIGTVNSRSYFRSDRCPSGPRPAPSGQAGARSRGQCLPRDRARTSPLRRGAAQSMAKHQIAHAAPELPDQSTIVRVRSSLADGSCLRGVRSTFPVLPGPRHGRSTPTNGHIGIATGPGKGCQDLTHTGYSRNQRLRFEEAASLSFGLVETSRSCGSRGRAMRRQRKVPFHPALRRPSLNSSRCSANRNG